MAYDACTICNICTDPFNKVRKPVECPRCEASACTRCVKTYLMNNTIEPKCMGCSSAWDMEFVRKNLSKSFLDVEYKKHQISALLSREEASLGDLQGLVPVRASIDRLTETIKTEKAQIKSWLLLPQEETRHRRFQTRNSLRVHQDEKSRLMQCWELGRAPDNVTETTSHHESTESTKAVFFMACPRTDCRGRVSSVYKCGLCQHWACQDCHADKGLERNGAPHECRKEDRETVQMLQQNTKNCPECHEGIFKEYGCDQMWCTRCRTCFSWNTGKKLNGAIHNPHYYEYIFQNRTTDAHADAHHACGGEEGFPNYHRLVEKWSRHDSGIAKQDQMMLNNTHRLVNHIRYVEMPRLQTILDDQEVKNGRKWGVEYLRHHISREEWGQKLYVAYRKKEREQRKLNIFDMFHRVTCDLYRNWYNHDMTGTEIIESLYKLLEYANENIQLFNKQYGTKVALLEPTVQDTQQQHILEYHCV